MSALRARKNESSDNVKKCFLNRNTKKPSRQLNIISTHDSPVAPNAGNVVGGVASLLFVYAVA